ncbi:MAG: hypothetical protein GY730_03695 [bacterium]|nr:hypothetical protein [bacterium]
MKSIFNNKDQNTYIKNDENIKYSSAKCIEISTLEDTQLPSESVQSISASKADEEGFVKLRIAPREMFDNKPNSSTK